MVGYGLLGWLIVKLIPDLRRALRSLRHLSWEWAAALVVLEIVSEIGFAVSWRGIVDPDGLLDQSGRRHMDTRAAWVQLGAGTVLPGGSWAGAGFGAWILHRLGMTAQVIAEREFNLSFLNTAIDALVLVIVGSGMATGAFSAGHSLSLTALPAAAAAAAVIGAALAARGASRLTGPPGSTRSKVARAIGIVAKAVQDTRQLPRRPGGVRVVAGAVGYLAFDALLLWTAFFAVNSDPQPGPAVVVMAYIIGALGGSLPLPAGVGTVGGITAMLILYGVGHGAALAAVVLYEATGLIVPLVGGAIAYPTLRHTFGPPGSDPGAS